METAFLKTFTDQLAHSGAMFSSITHVWAQQHRHGTQRQRTLGDDLTLGRHTRDILEQAWFTWQATHLAREAAKELVWSFAPDEFDSILSQL